MKESTVTIKSNALTKIRTKQISCLVQNEKSEASTELVCTKTKRIETSERSIFINFYTDFRNLSRGKLILLSAKHHMRFTRDFIN